MMPEQRKLTTVPSRQLSRGPVFVYMISTEKFHAFTIHKGAISLRLQHRTAIFLSGAKSRNGIT